MLSGMKTNSIIPSSVSSPHGSPRNSCSASAAAQRDSTSSYHQVDAEKRLPYRSIPTMMNGTARASKRRTLNDIDLTKSNIYNANNVDVQYAIRDVPIAKKLLSIISSNLYRVTSIVAVVLALFLYDISRTLPYSTFDDVTEYLLIVIFGFFLVDLVVQSIVYQSYIGSFFFWLDMVGTFTLLADLSFTYQLVGYEGLDAARGGRAGRAARTATTLRISRMVMWVRITRLVRVARMLRQFRLAIQNTFKSQSTEKEESAQSAEDWEEELDVVRDLESSSFRRDRFSTPRPSGTSRRSSKSSEDGDGDSSESGRSKESRYAKKHSGKIGTRGDE